MFFDNIRSLGLVLWIVVALMLVNSAIVILAVFTEDIVVLPDFVTNKTLYCIFLALGNVISAILYAVNAHRVMMGKYKTKIAVLVAYMLTVGMCIFVDQLFNTAAIIYGCNELAEGIFDMIAGMILSIIILVCAAVIRSEKKSFLKKVVWGLLVLSFIVLLVGSLLPCDSYWELADSIAHLLLAIFMLMFLLDEEVRTTVGVKR